MVRKMLVGAVGVAAMIAVGVGVWFRVSSLGWSAPMDGDEAFYGTQAARLARGKSFEWRTSSGNLIDPFMLVVQAPLLVVCEPAPWILKAPSVLAGLLMVGLAYPLLRKGLDGPTAVIATVALAVMPAGIVFNRVGCEFGQSPLFGLLGIAAALAGPPRRLLLAGAALLVVHPTNVFLFPTLAGAFVGRAWMRDGKVWSGKVVGTVGGLGVMGLAMVGWVWLGRTAGQAYMGEQHKGVDWGVFLGSLGRFVAGEPFYFLPADGGGMRGVVMGVGAAVLLGWGLVRLVRERAWDRLGLVAGFGGSLGAFHLVAGAGVLEGAVNRYGAFLIAPMAVVGAVLARDLVFRMVLRGEALALQAGEEERDEVGCVESARRTKGARADRGGASRGLDTPYGGVRLMGAGVALLGAFVALGELESRRFGFFRDRDGELIWTAGRDATDPWVETYKGLAREAEERGGKMSVIAQDWWTHRPLEFLDAKDRRLQIVAYDDLAGKIGTDAAREVLRRRLEGGDRAVGFNDQAMEEAVRMVAPADRIAERAERLGGVPYIVVHRLAPGPKAEIAEADGRVVR